MTPENKTVDVPAAAQTEIAAQQPPQPPRRATLEIIQMLTDRDMQQQYANQLIQAEVARDLFDQDYRLARIFAMSGKFDDLKGETAEQAISCAMAKIRLGRSWGMNESDAIAFIYFTNGRPNVMSEILATKIRQAGYAWDTDWHEETVQHKGKPVKKCTGCTLWLKQYQQTTNSYMPVLDRKGAPVSASFTDYDADTAQIWEKGKQISLSEKWNFKSWGRDMYFWRALGRLRKYHLTDVLRGGEIRELVGEVSIEEPQLLAAPQPEGEQPAARSLRDRVIEQADLLDPEE